MSGPLSVYRVYMRPWAWLAVALFGVLYFFLVIGNLTTFRLAHWRQTLTSEARQCSNQITGVTHEVAVNGSTAVGRSHDQAAVSPPAASATSTRSLVRVVHSPEFTLLLLPRENASVASFASSSSLPAACLASMRSLPDLLLMVPVVFDGPAYGTTGYLRWQWMVDLQPVIWVALLIIMIAWQHDMTRVAEVVALEVWILGANGITHILTVLPDAGGFHPACHRAEYTQLGRWVFTRISSQFCGDMLWSGHTFHTLLAMIIISRILKRERRRAKAEEDGSITLSELQLQPKSDTRLSRLSRQLHAFCAHRTVYPSAVSLMSACFVVEVWGILLLRYHYSIDCWVAIFVTLLATTSSWITVTARALYRPHILDELIAGSEKQRAREAVSAATDPFASCSCRVSQCCAASSPCGNAEHPSRAQPSPPPTPFALNAFERKETERASRPSLTNAAVSMQPAERHETAIVQPHQPEPTALALALAPAPAAPTTSFAPSHELPTLHTDVAAMRSVSLGSPPLMTGRQGQDFAPVHGFETEAPATTSSSRTRDAAALRLLRDSRFVMRYLSFPTRRAYEERLADIGSC